MDRRFLTGVSLALVLLLPCSAAAEDDAYDWLERMRAAMAQMSYQGTFVYIQGTGAVETMRLTHVVDEHGIRERLVSLSGTPREVLREDGHVRWITGPDHAIMADAYTDRPMFPDLPLDDLREAAASYEFELGGMERIAGHSGRRLNIIPRDEYRYGYSLWLEKHSGLLLQWILTEQGGDVLAQLLFTELKMGSQVDLDELRLRSSELKSGQDRETSQALRAVTKPPLWAPSDLPPGFRLASHRQQIQQDNVLEHLVYSDGIATVSVYVEANGETPALSPGLSRLGTTHAFCRSAESVVITVVGDVPARTVQRIGEGVMTAPARNQAANNGVR